MADPTDRALLRNIADNDAESFALKIEHLIRFGEYIDGKWLYRFASHPRFGYWAYNILYQHRHIGQGNFFLKQNPAEANLTVQELKDMLNSGDYQKVMSKLMYYAKDVSGLNAYWNQVRQDLKATISQIGDQQYSGHSLVQIFTGQSSIQCSVIIVKKAKR